MHVFVTVQNIWSLVKNVIQELGHEESSPLVLFTRKVHLVLQLDVVRLKQLIFILSSLKLLFDFLKLVLQKVNEIFISLIVGH